jgi:vitamin K epoxide reductase family protein
MQRRALSSAAIGAVASALGLFFAAFSTHDYAQHLDRQLHGTHCSFVPGLGSVTEGPNACTAAMYSPYSAVLRGAYWGGLPISLFALGAYAFFLAASVYLLTAREAAPRSVFRAYGVACVLPLPVSLLMAGLSATRLGGFCKLCVGLYVASLLLAWAGIKALRWSNQAAALEAVRGPAGNGQELPPALRDRLKYKRPGDEAADPPEPAAPPPASLKAGPAFLIVFGLLGLFAAAPAAVYAASLPDYGPLLEGCGKLAEPADPPNTLARLVTQAPRRKALLFVDPLCPTCKALHERLDAEGALEKLDASLLLFPLDSDCNWMLDRPVHPGACLLAKAVLCGDKAGRTREVLEWAYAEQESLRVAGKAGKEQLRARVRQRFADLDKCLDERETQKRLERGLHFAVANKVPVSTPQFYLGEARVCDEDTDLGLRFTLGRLAPEVLQ